MNLTRLEAKHVLNWTKSIIQCESDEAQRDPAFLEHKKVWTGIQKKARQFLRGKR